MIHYFSRKKNNDEEILIQIESGSDIFVDRINLIRLLLFKLFFIYLNNPI